MIWRCPACRGALREIESGLQCTSCGSAHEVIDGIPDLRHPAEDRAATDITEARSLLEQIGHESPEKMVRALFAMREGVEGWTTEDTVVRTRQSLESVSRLRSELDGWLAPVARKGIILDVGCGLGGLIIAANAAGLVAIGIDNRMTILVVARRLIERYGGRPVLVCANAEAMPLGDGAIGGVVMYDVVEHVDKLERVLAEVRRIIVPGGAFACSTPNRFSLAPEPHVHIWGVGWIPRGFQEAYVRRRSGRAYRGTQLLSALELRRMLRQNTEFDTQLTVPAIPPDELRRFSAPKRRLAIIYNLLTRIPGTRSLLMAVGPFFRIIGIDRRAGMKPEA